MSKFTFLPASPEAPAVLNDHFKANRSTDGCILDWGPSLTRQEFADEADINVLMSRFERTGVMPALNGAPPVYLDVSQYPADLQTAMDQIIQAEAAFMRLPAEVRREFQNDAVQFVEFASNPENLSQMRTWGLAPPEAVPEPPLRVQVIPDAPPVPPAPEKP